MTSGEIRQDGESGMRRQTEEKEKESDRIEYIIKADRGKARQKRN